MTGLTLIPPENLCKIQNWENNKRFLVGLIKNLNKPLIGQKHHAWIVDFGYLDVYIWFCNDNKTSPYISRTFNFLFNNNNKSTQEKQMLADQELIKILNKRGDISIKNDKYQLIGVRL